MKALLGFASAFTCAWVATYTWGLPGDVRAERREEIDCDLWHHQRLAARRGDSSLGTATEVLSRTLLGITSDITWRARAGTSARADRSIRMNGALNMVAVVAASVALALLFAILTGGYWMIGITVPGASPRPTFSSPPGRMAAMRPLARAEIAGPSSRLARLGGRPAGVFCEAGGATDGGGAGGAALGGETTAAAGATGRAPEAGSARSPRRAPWASRTSWARHSRSHAYLRFPPT